MDLPYLSIAATTDPPGSPAGPGPQQSQQPEQPTGGAVDTSGGEGAGGCSTGGCLGCGCLAAVVLVLLTFVGGGIAVWQLPNAVGLDGWDEMVEVAEGAQRLTETADPTGQADLTALDDTDQKDDAVANFDRVFTTLEETSLTPDDIRRTRDELEAWQNVDEVQQFHSIYESLQQLEDTDSALSQLAGLRDAARLLFLIEDLGRTYHEHIYEPLGAEYRQLNVIVRVSQAGSASEYESWEQAVADALIEDHEEHREEYEEAREMLRELQREDVDPEDLPEEQQMELAEAYAEHITMISAALNVDSLRAWAELTDDERRELLELLDAEHTWLGRYAAAVFHLDDHDEQMLFWHLAVL